MKIYFVILLLALVGCVSTVVPTEPLAESVLIVTRSGEQVFLQWASEPGIHYTVFYTDSSSAGRRWLPLPAAVKLRGTGEDFKISDSVPTTVQRRYRLQVDMPVRTK